jgi:hypothetical protein
MSGWIARTHGGNHGSVEVPGKTGCRNLGVAAEARAETHGRNLGPAAEVGVETGAPSTETKMVALFDVAHPPCCGRSCEESLTF